MHLKRHQLKSDRSYGLVFNEDSNLELAMYLNNPTDDDAELDALVEQFGFRPVVDNSPQSRRLRAAPHAAYGVRRAGSRVGTRE